MKKTILTIFIAVTLSIGKSGDYKRITDMTDYQKEVAVAVKMMLTDDEYKILKAFFATKKDIRRVFPDITELELNYVAALAIWEAFPIKNCD